ncbi:MAG: dynamin family protein [bacterium]
MRIAVVGAFSSGKSTFVNALIGRKVLPTRVEPTTATVTEVHNGPAGTASVRLKTEDEIRREQEEACKRREALESQADPDAREEEELRALESVARLDPDFQYPGGLPATFHLDRDADRDAIERFLADGPDSWAPYAERVTLEMPMDERAVPARAIIVDTPGSNSLSRLHRNATWRALIEADCVIFLVTARAPFSAHDRELLSDVRRVRQENGLKQGLQNDRFLFVANAIDDVEEEERERVRDYLKARLIELGIEEPRVELASALVACLAQTWAAGEQLSKRERRLLMDSTDDEPVRGWETSGLAGVMDRLWRTVGREAAQHLLDDALVRAGQTCDLTEEGQ